MSKPQAGPDLPEDVAEVLHDALEGRHRSAESYEEDVREAFQALPKANIEAAAAVCHDMGNEAMKSERYQEAVDHYTSVLAAHPHDNEVLANRSLAYLHLRQGPEALQDAALCVNLMPNWAKGYYRMGCALEECKAYKEAASVFAKVVEMEPENAEASGRLMKARRLLEMLRVGPRQEPEREPEPTPEPAFVPGQARHLLEMVMNVERVNDPLWMQKPPPEKSEVQVRAQQRPAAPCSAHLTTYHLLLTTCYLLLATCYLLLATYYLLLTTCYLPLTTRRCAPTRRRTRAPRRSRPCGRRSASAPSPSS